MQKRLQSKKSLNHSWKWTKWISSDIYIDILTLFLHLQYLKKNAGKRGEKRGGICKALLGGLNKFTKWLALLSDSGMKIDMGISSWFMDYTDDDAHDGIASGKGVC